MVKKTVIVIVIALPSTLPTEPKTHCLVARGAFQLIEEGLDQLSDFERVEPTKFHVDESNRPNIWDTKLVPIWVLGMCHFPEVKHSPMKSYRAPKGKKSSILRAYPGMYLYMIYCICTWYTVYVHDVLYMYMIYCMYIYIYSWVKTTKESTNPNLQAVFGGF